MSRVLLREVVRNREFEDHQNSSGVAPYVTQDVLVNPDNIVTMREDYTMCRKLKGAVTNNPELNCENKYTVLQLNCGSMGTTLIVVGSPEHINSMLTEPGKQLLMD